MRKFFQGYQFEINDLRALITVINVICIMVFGLKAAWLGLVIAICGLINDIIFVKRFNNGIIHLSNIVLNIFFLLMI